MNREPIVDEVVVITRNSGHGLTIGEKLIVCRVDESDQTIQGLPQASRNLSNWIPWNDVEPIAFGWDYVKEQLPPALTAILEACDGIEFISLNPVIKNNVLASLPDTEWHERVSAAVELLGLSDADNTVEMDADDDDDDDDDGDGDATRDCFTKDEDLPF